MRNDPAQIYLAGKVGGPKWGIVRGGPGVAGVSGATFVASDGGKHSEHEWGTGGWGGFTDGMFQDILKQTFLADIVGCDCLIAYLTDDTSFGTIAEIAYASAIGLKCYMILTTGMPGAEDYDDQTKYVEIDGEKHACYPATYADRMHDAYWFVSNFPNVRAFEVATEGEARQLVQALVEAHTAPTPAVARVAWDLVYSIGRTGNVQ